MADNHTHRDVDVESAFNEFVVNKSDARILSYDGDGRYSYMPSFNELAIHRLMKRFNFNLPVKDIY